MMASRWAMSSRVGQGQTLKTLVAMATRLTATMADDPLNHVLDGYRSADTLHACLRLLNIQLTPVALPLLEAGGRVEPVSQRCRDDQLLCGPARNGIAAFGPRGLATLAYGDRGICPSGDAFAATGSVWLRCRRYGDLKHALVGTIHRGRRWSRCAIAAGGMAGETGKLASTCGLPTFRPCRSRRHDPGRVVEDGVGVEKRSRRASRRRRSGAQSLQAESRHASPIFLLEVKSIRFRQSLHPFSASLPLTRSAGLFARIDLGLRKMAVDERPHLLGINPRWTVVSRAKPMTGRWPGGGQGRRIPWPGSGAWARRLRAGQFVATEQGEAMNLVNAKYGNTRA